MLHVQVGHCDLLVPAPLVVLFPAQAFLFTVPPEVAQAAQAGEHTHEQRPGHHCSYHGVGGGSTVTSRYAAEFGMSEPTTVHWTVPSACPRGVPAAKRIVTGTGTCPEPIVTAPLGRAIQASTPSPRPASETRC